jgi:hypothetical protein
VVGQVGVERDRVAGVQLVALAVDAQRERAVLDVGDLAGAGLVGSAGRPGRRWRRRL